MCGERASRRCAPRCASGSSPRVRGTRLSWFRNPLGARFIPACAGNALTQAQAPFRAPVHPRVCGERVAGSNFISSCCGSSPRVRGTQDARYLVRHKRRFIPACAGNAHPRRVLVFRLTVHPRVCGERRSTSLQSPPFAGSSPRVRGTHMRADAVLWMCRFIPACAGNASVFR